MNDRVSDGNGCRHGYDRVYVHACGFAPHHFYDYAYGHHNYVNFHVNFHVIFPFFYDHYFNVRGCTHDHAHDFILLVTVL